MKHCFTRAACSLFLLVSFCYSSDKVPFGGEFDPKSPEHVKLADQVLWKAINEKKLLSFETLKEKGILAIVSSFRKSSTPPQLTSPQKTLQPFVTIAIKKRQETPPSTHFTEETAKELMGAISPKDLFSPMKLKYDETHYVIWHCLRLDLLAKIPQDLCPSTVTEELKNVGNDDLENIPNIFIMLGGKTPYIWSKTEGKYILLNAHHLSQQDDGTVFCLLKLTHKKHHGTLHVNKAHPLKPIIRGGFNIRRSIFYQKRVLRELQKYVQSLYPTSPCTILGKHKLLPPKDLQETKKRKFPFEEGLVMRDSVIRKIDFDHFT